MATAANRGADKATALFQRGQKFYKACQYDLAERAFLKAMDLCGCGVAVQKQPRIDNEILSGIEKKDLKGTLARLSTFQRCGSRLHIDALDSLIATYETQSKLDEALEFALKMVNLSPREPKSYLRLGKVLRLKNQQTIAFYNYKQGIELVKRKNPNHDLLNTLRAQKSKVLRLATFDPMTELPIELVRMIFKFLDTKTRCRCLCVSKIWKTLLTSESLGDLWKVQEYTFTSSSQPTSPRFFKSFTSNWSYAGQSITELSIDGCVKFLRTVNLERLFRFFQHLKVLKLKDPRSDITLMELPENAKKPRLTKLFFGYGIIPSSRLLHQLLESSSKSLEELSVFNLPPPDEPERAWYVNWPKLENLKVVRLADIHGTQVAYVDSIVESAPNVQEAWLNIPTSELASMVNGWPRLQSLFKGDRINCEIFSAIDSSALNFPETLRELHIERFSESRGTQPSLYPLLQKLEKLSVAVASSSPPGSLFELFVRPGLESGTLREVHFDPLPARDFFIGPHGSAIPDWLRSDSVTYFNFAGFSLEGLYEHRLFEDVVLTIAKRFPNLSAINISNEAFPDTLLAKLIQRGVKTIYARHKPSIELRELASSEFGARFILFMPPPVPIYSPAQSFSLSDFLRFESSMF